MSATKWLCGTVFVFSLATGLAVPARASDYYWMGTGTWANVANWASSAAGAGGAYGTAPGAADDVYFGNRGEKAIIDADYSLRSLTISNFFKGVEFTNNTAATLNVGLDLYLGTGATLTVTRSSTNGNGAGRVITVGNNALIKGVINGDYKGFDASKGPGAGVYNTRGGSHGGRGGKAGLAPYGSLTQPTSLGSGGGNNATTYGGGAVKLVVSNNLTVDGSITVRGAADHDSAAGGSIWLVASNFTGSGALNASGGVCPPVQSHPGGGGGRIALEYTNSSFSGFITAAGGLGGADGPANLYLHGQPGTLWEPGRLPSSGDLTITGGCYQYWFPAGSTQSYGRLTIANLDLSGMMFLHTGTLSIRDLVVSNAMVRFDIDSNGTVMRSALDLDALAVTGSLVVASGSSNAVDAGYLYLPSQGAYMLDENLTFTSNTVVYALGNTNAVNTASGGTAGSPHGSGVVIRCANATLNGVIDGNTQGFGYNSGPGAGTYNNCGASYGGKGGVGAGSLLKPPYGSLTQPTALGSGAGNGAGAYGGGGAVKIEATNNLTLNGSISVNGLDDHDGSSGGSIWLIASNFAGVGSLSANGGDSSSLVNAYGAGGGGRISIQVTNSTFSGLVSASAGQGIYYAQPGTLWQPGRFSSPSDVTIRSGYQYFFVPGSTQEFGKLTIANPAKGGAVAFHYGNLVIGDLVVSNASLRFDVLTNGLTGIFEMDSLTITGTITVAAASSNGVDSAALYLPAQGSYALAGDLICRSNTVIYPLGNTAATNTDSGGTLTVRHGVGPAVYAANAFIDGTVNGDGLGFPTTNGPGSGVYNMYGASYGGRGGKPNPKAPYGSISRPSALGSGGYDASPGGGAIAIHTTNSIILNGAIVARGIVAHDAASGGSIWLKTKTLGGVGALRADGGDSNGGGTHPGGGGGRIAIECVTDTRTGILSAKGGSGGSPVATTGTWFYCTAPLNDRGVRIRSDYGTGWNTNGVKIVRTITQWTPASMKWDESSVEWVTGNFMSNLVTYTVEGLKAGYRYRMTDNGLAISNLVVTESGYAGPVSVVLTGGVHTVWLEGLGLSGTLMMVR